jgi:hydrogenase maturation protein HypF
VNYEAQAAIELEMAMGAPLGSAEDDIAYPMKLLPDAASGDGRWLISTLPLFEALLEDLARNVSVGAISRRFHNGLVECFVDVATRMRKKTTISRVCLSGGTFHNIYLSQRLEARLSEAGFEVFTQKEVPAGDGGLSLGQAVIAATSVRQS